MIRLMSNWAIAIVALQRAVIAPDQVTTVSATRSGSARKSGVIRAMR